MAVIEQDEGITVTDDEVIITDAELVATIEQLAAARRCTPKALIRCLIEREWTEMREAGPL